MTGTSRIEVSLLSGLMAHRSGLVICTYIYIYIYVYLLHKEIYTYMMKWLSIWQALLLRSCVLFALCLRLGKAVLDGEVWDMQQQGGIEVGGWKRLCWRIQQQGAIEVRGYRSKVLEKAMLDGELSGDTAAGGYRSRRVEKVVLEEELGGIQQQGALEVAVWKRLCWTESFRGIQQQVIDVGRHKSRALENALLEGDLWGHEAAEGYRSKGLWK